MRFIMYLREVVFEHSHTYVFTHHLWLFPVATAKLSSCDR